MSTDTLPDSTTLGQRITQKLAKWIILGGLGLAVLFAGYTWFTLWFSYSKGERAGYVQKFSQRGWVVKTWEGELAMVNLPGTMPEKFYFTVRDDALAKRLLQELGQRLSLTYEEHRGIPSKLFGDTGYFVTEFKRIEESSPGSP